MTRPLTLVDEIRQMVAERDQHLQAAAAINHALEEARAELLAFIGGATDREPARAVARRPQPSHPERQAPDPDEAPTSVPAPVTTTAPVQPDPVSRTERARATERRIVAQLGAGPRSVSELARDLHLNAGTVYGALTRLVERETVERGEDLRYGLRQPKEGL